MTVTSLPGQIRLRRVGPESVAVVAALVNAHSLGLLGTRRALIDAGGDLRLARYMPMSAEQYVAHVSYTAPVAFFHLNARPPHVVIELGCYLLSGFRKAAPVALAWLEERAREMARAAPPGARAVLQSTLLAGDAPGIEALEERGFTPVREWVHFALDLDKPPPVDIPSEIVIRPMDLQRDWPAVGEAMDEAFADHWGEMGPERRTLLEEDEAMPDEEPEPGAELDDDPYSNSPGLCFVAEADGRVVGSCLCNARTIEWPDSGKLGSLSVLQAYRRRGVASALTAVALAEFHQRGIRRVITDTDSASFTGANRFYSRFGFRPYRYEHVYEKELRAGKEWRVMSADEWVQ